MSVVVFRKEDAVKYGDQLVVRVNLQERFFAKPVKAPNRVQKFLAFHGWEPKQPKIKGRQRMETPEEAVVRLQVGVEHVASAREVVIVFEPDTGRAKRIKNTEGACQEYGIYQNKVFVADQ